MCFLSGPVGMVNKVGVDYVAVLVLGAFNVSIGRECMREDLEYKEQVRCLLACIPYPSPSSHTSEMGLKFILLVKKVSEQRLQQRLF
jgi:hypothetical protein